MKTSLIGVLVDEYIDFKGILIRDENKNVVSLSKFDMLGFIVRDKYGVKVKYNFIGDYVSVNGKEFVDCPLFDKNGNAILNKMELKYIVKSTSKGNPITGGVVYFEGIDKEMKCRTNDLAFLISYCNATNFTLSHRNRYLFLKGKNGCRIDELPVIIEDFGRSGGYGNPVPRGTYKV